jgi:DNA-binding winged helix-turn-helix (wHTH) protein
MRQPAQLMLAGGGRPIVLAQPVTALGRASTCQVVLQDEFASRHHAEIVLRHDTYWLRDCHSKNGILVDGQLVRDEVRLEDGATIQIGNTQLTFHDPAETKTQPALQAFETGLWVDEAARQVWLDGERLDPPLSPKQFEGLLYLWQRTEQAVSKDQIAAAVWPAAAGDVSNYQVDKLISRLRERLHQPAAGDPQREELIETVWGYGYRLRARAHP